MARWARTVAWLGVAVLLANCRGEGPRPDARSVESARAAVRATVQADAVLTRFYEAREYEPAWTDAGDRAELMSAIATADEDGLRPADYHVRELERLDLLVADDTRTDAERVSAAARRDWLLSDAFVLLASHLAAGRVDAETQAPLGPAEPAKDDAQWNRLPPGETLEAKLDRALEGGRVSGELEGLRPSHPEYAALRRALAEWRAFAQDASPERIPAGPAIVPGDRDPRLALVRARLAATGELRAAARGEEYDEALENDVRRFQSRNGLEPDGVIARATLEALNVPLERRVALIEANLERERWLPADLGDRHVEVDLPAFDLRLVESGEEALWSRVIVGTGTADTPTFSSRIEHVVLSPTWTVPRSILVEELAPQFRADPGLLSRAGFRVLREGVEIVPSHKTWKKKNLDDDDAPVVVQDPGPGNPLGRVKFPLPGTPAIYLHDSPSRHLFERDRRTFSHGCIRTERAWELAIALTGERDRTLQEKVAKGTPVWLKLEEPVPVHVVYRTVRADDDGVAFRPDPYGRDPPLLRALADATARAGP